MPTHLQPHFPYDYWEKVNMQGLLKGNNGYLSFGALETRCILDEVQFLLKGHQWLIFNHRLKSVKKCIFWSPNCIAQELLFWSKIGDSVKFACWIRESRNMVGVLLVNGFDKLKLWWCKDASNYGLDDAMQNNERLLYTLQLPKRILPVEYWSI